jgi:hypothetical protein
MLESFAFCGAGVLSGRLVHTALLILCATVGTAVCRHLHHKRNHGQRGRRGQSNERGFIKEHWFHLLYNLETATQSIRDEASGLPGISSPWDACSSIHLVANDWAGTQLRAPLFSRRLVIRRWAGAAPQRKDRHAPHPRLGTWQRAAPSFPQSWCPA